MHGLNAVYTDQTCTIPHSVGGLWIRKLFTLKFYSLTYVPYVLAARIALKWRGDQGTPELVWAAAQ